MSSKEEILVSIRRNRPAASSLPALDHEATTYADRRQQFIEVLTAVGGTVVVVREVGALEEAVQALPFFAPGQKVVSLVPGMASRNFDSRTAGTPHGLADVDLAVLPGEFAVAENGAVWVTDREMPARVLYFLCQHLVLVIAADAIVDHMHAAYERIGARAPAGNAFERPLFGAFISGPSKTADIEQSLVIGAHGPRSLTVVLVETC